MIFPLFWLTLIIFFSKLCRLSYANTEWCTIYTTDMIIKNSFFKILTFMKKSCTAYNNSDALQS